MAPAVRGTHAVKAVESVLADRPCSSTWQSSGLLIRWLEVRILSRAPALFQRHLEDKGDLGRDFDLRCPDMSGWTVR